MEIPQQIDPFEGVNFDGIFQCKQRASQRVGSEDRGMMLLKNIYNLRDEGVVARLLEIPYMLYFTGEKMFQKRPSMKPSDSDEVLEADRSPRSREEGALD